MRLCPTGQHTSTNTSSTLPEYIWYLETWNRLAAGKLPAVREITKQRREAIKKREDTDPQFRQKFEEAVGNMVTNPFYIGQSAKGDWKADFDFMFQTKKDRVVQLIEQGRAATGNPKQKDCSQGF